MSWVMERKKERKRIAYLEDYSSSDTARRDCSGVGKVRLRMHVVLEVCLWICAIWPADCFDECFWCR